MFNPAWHTTHWDADVAVSLTGPTPSQLEYFVRQGLIVPAQPASRRGVSRRYDLKNLIEMAVATEMLASGLPVGEIGRALAELRGNWALVFGDAGERARAAVLLVTVSPMTAIRPDPHPLVQVGPVKMLTAYAHSVTRVAVPIEAIVRNICGRIFALEQWQASKPGR